jgi:hypothetical protein
MTIKTAKDLTTSLRGAAFRRATCDGRSWFVRAIKTLRTLRVQGRPTDAPLGQPHLNGRLLRDLPVAERRQMATPFRSIG